MNASLPVVALVAASLWLAAGRSPQMPRPSSSRTAATDTACVADLDSMAVTLRRDYPGYRQKVSGHAGELAALTDSVRAAASTADGYVECVRALQRWVHFFHDPHMVGPWQASKPAAGSHDSAASALASTGVPRDDPDRPTLRRADDSTLVLRLPNFDLPYRPLIDSLIERRRSILLSTPYLIVDVRGNGGGCTCSFEALSPLLYAGPVREPGSDVLASKANLAWFQGWLDRDVLPASDAATIRAAVARMKAHPGQLVEFSPDTTIRRDTVYPRPRAVALLVDGGCASSCEDLVQEARQSRKVTVVGAENTAGVHDFGNIRKVYLPGYRQMMVPTTRTRGPHIDGVGFKPDVRVPKGAKDVVAFASHWLESRPRSRR